MSLFFAVFINNLTAQKESIESIINIEFEGLNDSAFIYSFASKNIIKLKFNNVLVLKEVFLKRILYTTQSINNINNIIYITFYNNKCIAGHFDIDYFKGTLNKAFFIYSIKYNLFCLFNFVISFVDYNEKSEIVTNQNRKSRFTFIGASPIELYIYNNKFQPQMKIDIYNQYVLNNRVLHKYCFFKTHYTTLKEKESSGYSKYRFFNVDKFYNLTTDDFFKWINGELKEVDNNKLIKCVEPHDFFCNQCWNK